MFKLPHDNKQKNAAVIKSMLTAASHRVTDATNRCYTIEVTISKLDEFSLLIREQEDGHYAVGYSRDNKTWHLTENTLLDDLRKLTKKREVKKGLKVDQLCRKVKSKMIALSKENSQD